MIEWLKGKKTYIVAVCMIFSGLGLILNGQTQEGILVILNALGLGALRAGVTKSGPSE
jgi:hypothetical protein